MKSLVLYKRSFTLWAVVVISVYLASSSLAQPVSLGADAPTPHSEKRLTGANVPLPVRISSLMQDLGQALASDAEDGANRFDRRMLNRGLDPESAAARELAQLVTDLEANHPVVSEELKQQALTEGSMDLTNVGGWLDQRYAKIGRAVGAWLQAREREGWAIEPLVDRVFKSSLANVTLFSDNDDFEDDLLRYCSEFNTALSAELGFVPRQFIPPDRNQLAEQARQGGFNDQR